METQVKELYKSDFAQYLLCLALDVGEGILKNGGEVSRVEDTIERICYAYGAAHVEVFSIISFINAAIRMPDGSYSTQLRRVRSTANNLHALELYNALSREICATKPELDVFDQKIHEIKQTRSYSLPVVCAASAVVALSFSFFFGGGVRDAVIASFIGVLIALTNHFALRHLNPMAGTVTASFFASIIAALFVEIGFIVSDGFVMIGSIMLLVPGLAFGTAIRDLLLGDLLAGILKSLQACLSALMIAFGYLMATAIMGGLL